MKNKSKWFSSNILKHEFHVYINLSKSNKSYSWIPISLITSNPTTPNSKAISIPITNSIPKTSSITILWICQRPPIFIKVEVCLPPKTIKSIVPNLTEPCTAQPFKAHCQVKASASVNFSPWADSLATLNNLAFKTINPHFSFPSSQDNRDNSILGNKSKKPLRPSNQQTIKINLTAFLLSIYRTIIQINKAFLRTIININLASRSKKPKMLLKLWPLRKKDVDKFWPSSSSCNLSTKKWKAPIWTKSSIQSLRGTTLKLTQIPLLQQMVIIWTPAISVPTPTLAIHHPHPKTTIL